MKFDFLKSISPLEIFLFILFVIYIIFPINTPEIFIPFINSCIGMVIIFIATIYLLFYTTPVLAILAIFAAFSYPMCGFKAVTSINEFSRCFLMPS